MSPEMRDDGAVRAMPLVHVPEWSIAKRHGIFQVEAKENNDLAIILIEFEPVRNRGTIFAFLCPNQQHHRRRADLAIALAGIGRCCMKNKNKETGGGRLRIVLICVLVLLGGYYYRKQVVSKLTACISKARSVLPMVSDRHSPVSANSKRQMVSSTNGKFTFFPDEKSRYAWSVKYPDGRVFKLGEEFSSDCTPTLKLAKRPDTTRFEFNEQRGCNSRARKSIQVDADSLKDVHADGSPELVSAILTGGNVYGHTSSLISLTPRGPKVTRHLD